MAEIKVYYDHVANSLTVWFGNPKDEYICQETAEEVVMMKNRKGEVVGFEKLNFEVTKPDHLKVAFETTAS